MAVRHAFQAELYGLTPAQRTNGAASVNAALDGEQVSEVSNRTVDPNRVKRGQAELFVEVDFSTEGAGTRIHEVARSWASTRSVTAANGEKSYVTLRSRDDQTGVITMRRAESPGWVTATTTENTLV